jgi:chromosome segregation ATPase
MPPSKNLILGGLLYFSAILIVFLGVTVAQTGRPTAPAPADDGRVVQSLLNEVRLLRLALQRSHLNVYRAQITIERLRLQQAVVDHYASRLEEVRSEILNADLNHQRVSDRIKDLENQIGQERDPSQRSQLERLLSDLRKEADRLARAEGQEREREAQLTPQLQIEQAKLNEISARLEALESELETQQSVDKTRQDVKP